MARSTLLAADPERGWDDLRFPPPWWELPAVVGVLAGVSWLSLGRSYLDAVYGGGLGALLFLMHYVDGERALMHRLETRLAETQLQLDGLTQRVVRGREEQGR